MHESHRGFQTEKCNRVQVCNLVATATFHSGLEVLTFELDIFSGFKGSFFGTSKKHMKNAVLQSERKRAKRNFSCVFEML